MNNNFWKFSKETIGIILLIITSIILLISYPWFIGYSISNKSSEWSNYGQFVGGIIGPILSLLSFLGTIYLINNQKKDTQKSETENRIIKLIDFHNNLCRNVKMYYGIKDSNFREGREAFGYIFDKELRTFYLEAKYEAQNKNLSKKEEDLIYEAFDKLYKKLGKNFGFYFRNLHFLVKYIDDSKYVDKDLYIKLVRAQLSIPETQLLMYNCLSEKGKNFKSLVEKYNLLNIIDDSIMLDKSHKNLFKVNAFN